MPGKHTAILTTDDALIRLIDLPDAERNRVLRDFARSLAAAERRALVAFQTEYAATHPPSRDRLSRSPQPRRT